MVETNQTTQITPNVFEASMKYAFCQGGATTMDGLIKQFNETSADREQMLTVMEKVKKEYIMNMAFLQMPTASEHVH